MSDLSKLIPSAGERRDLAADVVAKLIEDMLPKAVRLLREAQEGSLTLSLAPSILREAARQLTLAATFLEQVKPLRGGDPS